LPALRFAIVVSRFNEEITGGLLAGAKAALADAGIADDHVTVIDVPGAFEIPLVARGLAASGRFNGVICLGCLIKGDTMHFEYIAAATTQGIMDAGLATGIPQRAGVGLHRAADVEQQHEPAVACRRGSEVSSHRFAVGAHRGSDGAT
jgi:6,7-dimethyl-8-ribityllumazine synthase